MCLELASKRKPADNYVKQMYVYHWTAVPQRVPIEHAECFTGGRLPVVVQCSSLVLEFSFEYEVWDNCPGFQ